jgi:hypothetical protein
MGKFSQAKFGTTKFGSARILPRTPRFGEAHFGCIPFGDSDLPPYNYKKSFRRVGLGQGIRKQLAKEVIYRIRPGNGHAGSKTGVFYQDKYKYFVPSSINNEEGAAARTALANAVAAWKELEQSEKESYNIRADRIGNLSGYNLFIKEQILENV